jgi:hypothetical protein
MKIINFVKNYNILEPDWSKLPPGFPNCDISELNNEEKIIWEIIVLAWINEHPVDYLGQKVTNTAFLSLALLLVSTIFVSFLYYADIKFNLGLKFLTDFFA